MFVSNRLLATGVIFEWLAFIRTLNLHSSNDFALFDSVIHLEIEAKDPMKSEFSLCLVINAYSPKSQHKIAHVL